MRETAGVAGGGKVSRYAGLGPAEAWSDEKPGLAAGKGEDLRSDEGESRRAPGVALRRRSELGLGAIVGAAFG